MTDHNYIIGQLEANKGVFKQLFSEISPELQLWKPSPEKWCLLEIVCHLIDEERLDFKFRAKWLLENPEKTPPSIDPVGWVTEHRYIKQDYIKKVEEFISEREASVNWLKSLENPNWELGYDHQKLGRLTAGLFMNNWLAHDYLHLRQIAKLKFDYLKMNSREDLNYAGNW